MKPNPNMQPDPYCKKCLGKGFVYTNNKRFPMAEDCSCKHEKIIEL